MPVSALLPIYTPIRHVRFFHVHTKQLLLHLWCWKYDLTVSVIIVFVVFLIVIVFLVLIVVVAIARSFTSSLVWSSPSLSFIVILITSGGGGGRKRVGVHSRLLCICHVNWRLFPVLVLQISSSLSCCLSSMLEVEYNQEAETLSWV